MRDRVACFCTVTLFPPSEPNRSPLRPGVGPSAWRRSGCRPDPRQKGTLRFLAAQQLLTENVQLLSPSMLCRSHCSGSQKCGGVSDWPGVAANGSGLCSQRVEPIAVEKVHRFIRSSFLSGPPVRDRSRMPRGCKPPSPPCGCRCPHRTAAPA